jgi:CheY-like chemotaxis protein
MKPVQPAKIILIEDNPVDVFLIRYGLDEQGFDYRLEVLEDGEQALRFIREYGGHAGEPSPCVVVLDLHLPKYDGFEVLRALRKAPALADVRVVAFTGVMNAAEEATLRSFGVRLHREKPNDIDDVLELGAEIIAICKDHVLTAPI